MNMAENSSTRNSSSLISVSSASSSPFDYNLKRRKNLKKKSKSNVNKSARVSPDLDIVHGFAFLSFSSLEDLEHHIEETEAKSCSLSINVGQKRKIQPTPEEKSKETLRKHCVSKRIRIPSQKILESFATNDIPINKIVEPQGLRYKQTGIFMISQESEPSSLCMNSSKSQYSESAYRFPDNIHVVDDQRSDHYSLECSETLDSCMFDDDDIKPIQTLDNNSNIEKGLEKRPKKKKQNKVISDTSCQTMFRIKKKKKLMYSDQPRDQKLDVLTENSDIDVVSITEVVQEDNQPELSEDLEKAIDMVTVEVPGLVKEDTDLTAKEKYKKLQATKFFDSRYPKAKNSNKVEKIDYCARSGGVNLVERHHQRQARLKDECNSSNCNQQFPPIDDESLSIHSDNSNSGNESNSASADNEDLFCDKSRIFAGATSVYLSAEEEESCNGSEIDIGSSFEESLNLPINIVKALPENYLFGHFSTYNDQSSQGTIDVSIQVYDNDIQLYMNYASDFNGKIIKIITPDHEETSRSSNTCVPHSSVSGVAKFLQPKDYVKAIRSATERNRRHNLGDLFNHLKNEIFGDVREFYFSKQSILSKALEVISSEDQQHYELNKEKAKLSSKNQLLRESLNKLLFGESTRCNKKVDVDKVTDYLKTFNIKIQMPNKEDKKQQFDKSSQEQGEMTKNVSKKGRPPLGVLGGSLYRKTLVPQKPATIQPDGSVNKVGDCLKSIQMPEKDKHGPSKVCTSLEGKHMFVPIQPKQTTPEVPKPKPLPSVLDVAISNKVKEFVAIAPRVSEKRGSTEDKDLTQDDKGFSAIASQATERYALPKEPSVNISNAQISTASSKGAGDIPLSKIVCNISRYRVQQPGSAKGMTWVTNPTEPLKTIESKNVVHIKIANDTMKQMSDSGMLEPSKTVQNLKSTNEKTKLNQGQDVCLCSSQDKTMSAQSGTQTNPSEMLPSTDFNSLRQIGNTTTDTGTNQQTMLTKPSMAGKTPTVLTVKSRDCLKKLVSILRGKGMVRRNSLTLPKTRESSAVTNQTSPATVVGSVNLQSSPETLILQAQTSAIPSVSVSSTRPTTTQVEKTNLAPIGAPNCVTTPVVSTTLNWFSTTLPKLGTKSAVSPTTTEGPAGVTNQEQVSMVSQGNVAMATSQHGDITSQRNDKLAPITSQHCILTEMQQHVTMATQVCVAQSQGPCKTPTTPIYAVGSSHNDSELTMLKQTVVTMPSEKKLVKVLPQPSSGPIPHGRQVNIVPNSVQPIRILFKPTGKPIINSSADHVKDVIQSQQLLRIPIANSTLLPQNSTTTSNALQAPNIRFLLQNANQSALQTSVQQAGINVSGPVKTKQPQVVYTKPFVKIQPQPQSIQNSAKQLPFASTSAVLRTSSDISQQALSNTAIQDMMQSQPLPVQTPSKQLSVALTTSTSSSFSAQQGLISTTKGTPLNSKPSYSSSISLNNQTALRSSTPTTVTSQCIFNLANSSHPMIIPQQGKQQTSMFQQQVKNPPTISTQGPVTTATAINSKKTILSGMEEIVAKIPSTFQQQRIPLSKNNIEKKMPSPLKATVVLQRISPANAAKFNSVISNSPSSQLPLSYSSNNRNSLHTMSEVEAAFLEVRPSSCPSPSTTVQASVALSNSCSSSVLASSFRLPSPKQDKTCSVVESVIDNSNVVTADTLSTWNIDSSIPDIKSELQGGQQDSSLAESFNAAPSKDIGNPGFV